MYAIGNKLKEHRLVNGLTAQQVSYDTGISVQMIYNIEKGKYNGVNVKYIIKLGKYYVVDFNELFS